MGFKRILVIFRWRRFLQLFLQGLVVLAPIVITVYAVVTLFNTIDNILPNIIHSLFPHVLEHNSTGELERTPGLGFVVVILIVLLVGWISSSFVVTRLVHILDKVLEKTPGVRFIYTSVKDFMEAFAGNKKKFDQPVLVNVDGPDIWRVGFLTQESAAHFELEDYVVVYVPHSYAISGITYLVPRYKVKPIKNTGASDAMKFVVSGGVTHVD
ncbi:transporter [Filimonas lacunae]|nr:transporter [Filimonas lacunae]